MTARPTVLFTQRSAIRAIVGELRGDGRGWILLVIGVGWFLSLGTQLVFPSIMPHLQAEFDLSLTVAGSVMTVLWMTYALCQLPSGIVGDRIGSGRLLVVSTAAAGVVAAFVATSVSAGMLIIGAILFGLATAPYGPLRYAILTDVYAEREGTAIGITLAAGNVGNSVLPIVAGLLATYLSWRFGFGLLVPLFLLTAIGVWLFVPSNTGETTSSPLSVNSLRYVAENVASTRILLVTMIQICAFFSWQGFTAFYPTYLVDVKSITPGVASILFGTFFAVGVVVQPIAGGALDRFGIRPVLYVIGTVIVVSLGSLPFVEGVIPLTVLTIFLSSLLGFTPVTHTYLTNQLPSDMKGRGLGLLRTLFMTISGVAPLLVGVMADRGPFDYVFFLLSGVCLLALLLVFLIPRE